MRDMQNTLCRARIGPFFYLLTCQKDNNFLVHPTHDAGDQVDIGCGIGFCIFDVLKNPRPHCEFGNGMALLRLPDDALKDAQSALKCSMLKSCRGGRHRVHFHIRIVNGISRCNIPSRKFGQLSTSNLSIDILSKINMGTHRFRSLSVSSILITSSCSSMVSSPPGRLIAKSFA